MKEILGVKLYGVKETAALLQTTAKTVYLYTKVGKLSGVKIAGLWYYTEDSIRSFLKGEK